MVFKNITQDKLKSIASQYVACASIAFLFLDLGLACNISTIIVPKVLNAREGLSLNDNEASWFGSIPYLVQPLGGLLSGALVEIFGLKRAIFIVNIPHIVAWPLMYFAYNLPMLFTSNALMGFGVGLMEAPINSYIGEISEPSTRGALTSSMQMLVSLGTFILYYLGLVVSWRDTALISLFSSIASVVLTFFAPDSPVRLLYQGKDKQALKSLCFIRGWTTAEKVHDEFSQLSEYSKNLKQCLICESKEKKRNNETKECEHDKLNFIIRNIQKFRFAFFCKETMRPLIFMLLYFAFFVMSGLSTFRPNMINVCQAFGMAEDGGIIAVNCGIINLVSSILVIIFIKLFGKRKIALTSMLLSAISTALLSNFARLNLDSGVFSYNTETYPETQREEPLIYFYMLSFVNAFSLHWYLFSEIFPFKSRATAQGTAAAGIYVLYFLASKTFINLELSVHLWGTFAVYSVFGILGTVYLYFFLPETEGKTLQEIENYYNGEFRTFADDPIINNLKKCKCCTSKP